MTSVVINPADETNIIVTQETTNLVVIEPSLETVAISQQGMQGIQGVPGTSIFVEPRAPLVSEGVDGDSFLNSATGQLFKKVAGVWIYQGSLLGPSFSIGQVDGGVPSSIYGGTFVIYGGVP